MAQQEPSIDQWLKEAKQDPQAAQCGMFLTHNGVVRITPKAQVREIAELKMPDLNAADVEAAMRMVAGTARSMGVVVGE